MQALRNVYLEPFATAKRAVNIHFSRRRKLLATNLADFFKNGEWH